MNKDKQFGYYRVSIKSDSSRPLFNSNNQRAFIISSLQSTLSMRTVLEGHLGKQSLATHIDLLAFSLLRPSCELVLFAISRQAVDVLCRSLCSELQDYSKRYTATSTLTFSTHTAKLSGPHDALHQTVLLHVRHGDWENDRYSSVGFYLHDRRGDWMRTWRLVHLYQGDPEKYRKLITSQLRYKRHGISAGSTGYLPVTSLHA